MLIQEANALAFVPESMLEKAAAEEGCELKKILFLGFDTTAEVDGIPLVFRTEFPNPEYARLALYVILPNRQRQKIGTAFRIYHNRFKSGPGQDLKFLIPHFLRVLLRKVAEKRNWTEDAPHENGNYQNRCAVCNHMFIGHKRRVMCKVCGESPNIITKAKNAIKDVAKGIAKDAEDYVSTHRPMTNVERAIYALAWVSAAKDWPYTPDKPFPPSDVALLMAADKATIAVLRFREAGEHITDTNGWDSEMWKFYADAAGVDEREHPPIHTSCGG